MSARTFFRYKHRAYLASFESDEEFARIILKLAEQIKEKSNGTNRLPST